MQKILKKMGFPDIESAATPTQTMPKAVICVDRRVQRLAECMDALGALKKTKDELKKTKDEKSKVSETLGKFPGCRSCADLISTGMQTCK